jgi:hypothetical protein
MIFPFSVTLLQPCSLLRGHVVEGTTSVERQYIHTTGAWYGPILRQEAEWEDEIIFGCCTPDGDQMKEARLRWYRLEADQPPVPRLELFDDAWGMLAAWPDVWAALAALQTLHLSPGACWALLKRLGFVDRTPRQGPTEPWQGLRQPQVYRHLIRLANDLTQRWLHLAHCRQTPELACQMAVLDRKLIQVEAELLALQDGLPGVDAISASEATPVSV